MVFADNVAVITTLILLLANMLRSLTIDKLVVPETIASDSLDAVLDCVYSGATDDVTLQWLYNGRQVYEWKQGSEPRANDILDGHLDLSYKIKNGVAEEKRLLRIIELTPELSGDYTCVVRSRALEAHRTKTMTVFSPEREFKLIFSPVHELHEIEIKCVAKRLHPQPVLTIEYNKIPVGKQQQRVWREGMYFDSECNAVLSRREVQNDMEIACRLHLPQVDYTAITKKYLNFEQQMNEASALRVTDLLVFSNIMLAFMR